MQTDSRTVTVYAFRTPEAGLEGFGIARFKAPRDAVLSRYHGEVLEGTGEEVPVAELDAEGRYRRIATGWGELS